MRAALMTSAFVTGYMGKMAAAMPGRRQAAAVPETFSTAPLPFRNTPARRKAIELENEAAGLSPSGYPIPTQQDLGDWQSQLRVLEEGDAEDAAATTATTAPAAPAAPAAPVVDPTAPASSFVPVTAETLGAAADIRGEGPTTGPVELRGAAPGTPGAAEEGWNWNNQYTRGAVGGFGVGAGVSALLDWARDKPISVKRMLLVGILGGAGNTIFRALGGWKGITGQDADPDSTTPPLPGRETPPGTTPVAAPVAAPAPTVMPEPPAVIPRQMVEGDIGMR